MASGVLLPVSGISRRRLFTALVLLSFVCGCSELKPTGPEEEILTFVPAIERQTERPVEVRIAKWRDDHAGAISLTYDHGWCWPVSESQERVLEKLKQYDSPMEFDSGTGPMPEGAFNSMREIYAKHGVRFFGHGYLHLNHDSLTYQEAYASFARCRRTLDSLGLNPIAYAYPGDFCYDPKTRRAVEDAGFLAARRHHISHIADPYIVPFDELEPEDWFQLPSLIVQNYEFEKIATTIHGTDELIPFLDETVKRTAWIIATYHEIKNGHGGTYREEKFETDLQAIAERDLWAASFNEATLYVRERSRASVTAVEMLDSIGGTYGFKMVLTDGRTDPRYTLPLTLVLSTPHLAGRKARLFRGSTYVSDLTFGSPATMIDIPPDEHEYRIVLID